MTLTVLLALLANVAIAVSPLPTVMAAPAQDVLGNWSFEPRLGGELLQHNATTSEDYKWAAFTDYDLPDSDDVEAMEAGDLDAVKRRVIEKGYSGFSVNNGWAFLKDTPEPLTKDDLQYVGGRYPVVFYIKGPKVLSPAQPQQAQQPAPPPRVDYAGAIAPMDSAAPPPMLVPGTLLVNPIAFGPGASASPGPAVGADAGAGWVARESAAQAAAAATQAADVATQAAAAAASQAAKASEAAEAEALAAPWEVTGPAAVPGAATWPQSPAAATGPEPTVVVLQDPDDEPVSWDEWALVCHVLGLCLAVGVYSLLVKTMVMCSHKQLDSSTHPQDEWLTGFDGELPPVLNTLDQMRPHERIDGAAVKAALKFPNLLDLLQQTPEMAFEDTSHRAPLCHADLYSFVRNIDLTDIGLGPGDRMACLIPNGAEAAVLIMCAFAKCTIVPLNPSSTHQEIISDAGRVRAKLLIAHRDYMENPKQCSELTASAAELGIGLFSLNPDAETCGKFVLRHVPGTQVPSPSVSRRLLTSPEDTSLLLFTSGTSGSKKCVPYTLSTLVIGSTCIVASWELRPSDRVCNMMPLFHVGGICRNVLSPVLSGGSAMLCSSFDPILFWDIIEQRGKAITWYYAGPVMHQLILDEFKSRGLPSYRFRFIANAAGGLLPSLALEMRANYGCTVLPGYGMTECMPISAPPLSYKLDREGTSGRRVGPELKIFSDEGKDVPPGTVGNIVVRGPPLFAGYEGDAESTREAFFPGDWFNTGDLGWLDQDGYLYITGRSKEVINRGGEIISPFEVEEAIQSHPRVKCCIAFSVPHEVLEEGIGIAVVADETQPYPSLRSIQQWCKQSLTFAKWPQVLVIMTDLPKNHANKPLRVKLADRLKLKDFWRGAMVDGMPEVSRTFFADCPAKGASLKENIPNVRALTVDVEALGRRLHEAGRDLGVHEAAAAQVGSDKRLCACVTPDGIDTKRLLERIRETWHDWDVPLVLVSLATLPRLNGGDAHGGGAVDSARLARLLEVVDPDYVGPSNTTEELVQRIWEEALEKPRISIDADFFELGGTSLLVGPLALTIQEESKVPFTAVDIFNSPTIQATAALIENRRRTTPGPESPQMSRSTSAGSQFSIGHEMAVNTERSWGSMHPLVLAFQLIPVMLFPSVMRCISYIYFVHLFIWAQSFFETRCLVSVVMAILLSHFLMSLTSPLMLIAAKWTLIGQQREGQYPLWGSTYLKWWIMSQLENFFSRGIFYSNLPLFYRLLGANIGSGVKISSDAKISDFDLLTIGDNVALDNCTVRPFSMNTNNCFTLRRIHIGSDSVVCAKSVIAGGARLAQGTNIGPLSSSHEYEDSRPENRLACRLLRKEPPFWLQVAGGWPILLIQKIVSLTPVLMLMQKMTTMSWYDGKLASIQEGLAYVSTPERMAFYVGFMVTRKVLSPFLSLGVAIVVKRALIHTFEETPEGSEPDTSDWELFRTWLLGRLIPDAHLCGTTKLLGRHYEAVSFLYRLLGVKVGKYVYWPGSGFKFQEPDLVELGDYVVFGSRSLFLTSDSTHRRQAIRVEPGSNVSDRCVLLPGTTVKCGAILGSGALTKQGATYQAGTYVGSRANECVLLKKSGGQVDPQESSYARAFTKSGKMPYYVYPEWVHIIWSTLCIALACVIARLPIVLSLVSCHYHFNHDWMSHSSFELLSWIGSYIIMMYPLVLILVLVIDISSKWIFMGRRQPGSHSWDTSSYSQRWQLYLSLAPVRSFCGEHDFLELLRGTQFLVWYFRMLGAKIGKNVCLYPNGADPMMTEPELVTIRDGACIDDASLIAHLNTQGVFTINTLEVGERCVMCSFSRLQQSAVMEPRSVLREHTLVLPADTVQAGECRQGWPAGRGFMEENDEAWEDNEWNGQDARRLSAETRALLCCT